MFNDVKCKVCGEWLADCECSDKRASGSASAHGSAAGRVADKWKCSLEEAEHKITATMEILALDRDNAVAFLDEVRLEIGRQPPNSKVSYHADNAGGAHGKESNGK